MSTRLSPHFSPGHGHSWCIVPLVLKVAHLTHVDLGFMVTAKGNDAHRFQIFRPGQSPEEHPRGLKSVEGQMHFGPLSIHCEAGLVVLPRQQSSTGAQVHDVPLIIVANDQAQTDC